MATITIPIITTTFTASLTSYIISTITVSKQIPGGLISTTVREVTATTIDTTGVSTLQNITDILITVLATVILSIITICIQRCKIKKLRKERDNQIIQTTKIAGVTPTIQPEIYNKLPSYTNFLGV